MELSDALQRIVGQYWRLILWFTLLAVIPVAMVHVDDPKTYTAATRLVLDTEDPESQTESTSIADTANAIATSPSQVKGAMVNARVRGRDPVEVAENDVSLRALGASAVLELSVSDRNPRAAAAMSNALAERVIQARLAVTSGQLRQVLASLAKRIDRLSRRIAQVDATIDSTRRKGLPDLLRQRDRLTQQRGTLESSRVSALSTDAQRHAPAVISPASIPDRPDSGGLLPDLVLAALLGLVGGLGLAGLIEAVRPTLVRGEALASEFDTPLLGTLSVEPTGHLPVEDARRVAMRLRLAAKAAGLRHVGLIGMPENADLRPLAERLAAASDEVDRAGSPTLTEASRRVPIAPAAGPSPEKEQRGEAQAVAAHRRVFRIQPYDLAEATQSTNGPVTGLAFVLPIPIRKAELDHVKHLLRVSLAPLLGVIAYRGPRYSQRDRPPIDAQETVHRGG